ncbi:choice-of-anchor D domain-containing protein [candidate division KSB1 bacterium]|nr:choice-of-anchor D domain-containing protein [candidate division KSB1 bacterium]
MRKISGHFILLKVLKLLLFILFIGILNVGAGFAQVLWQQTNGPAGGNVPSLAINNTSGALFAGCEAGVFRSENNGDTWTSVSAGLPATTVLNIAVNSSGHIFAGSYMSSLYRSMDNGATWELKNTGLPPDFDINALVINPAGIIVVASFNGIYRSTDNGENWTMAITPTGGPAEGMDVLYVTPNGNVMGGNYNGVFEAANNGDSWSLIHQIGSVYAMGVNSAGDIFTGSYNGVQRLLFGQQTWEYVNTGLPTTVDIKRISINSSGVLFAGTYDGLYRSTDNGNNWTSVNTGLTSTNVNAIIFNSTGATFTATSGGVFSSADNGNNWTRKINGLVNSTVRVLNVGQNGNFYAGTSSGLFRSTDTGSTWNEIPTLAGKSVKYIIFNTAGNAFAGTEFSGVYRSLDNGVTWALANTGLTSLEIRAMTINATGQLFVATYTGLFRSTDNGANWTNINNTLSEPSSLVVDSDGDMFAATYNGIYRSVDNGVTWNIANANMSSVNFLKIRPDGYIFACTSMGISVSDNKGVTWIDKNNGLTDTQIQTLYISRKGHLFAGTRIGGLFRSTDLGDNWIAANNGLSNPSVHALVMNNAGDFLAGTMGSGVFSSQYDNSIHSVSPTAIDYGNVRTNTTRTDSVVVTNTGYQILNVSLFNMSGPNAANFVVMTAPFQLSPGESRAVQIDFTPGSRSTHTASLDIVTSGGTSTVSLTGTGIAPVMSLLMTTFDIGLVRSNTTQQIDSLYLIANDGDDSLLVTSAGFTGTDAVNFAVTDHINKTAPGEDGWFSFSFTPDRTGPFTAQLSIQSDGGSGDVTITGTGTAPVLEVTPLSIDFADVAIGASALDTILVKNTGTDILNVSLISVGGTDAAYFTLNTTPFTLGPGDSTELQVSFTPESQGTFYAEVLIESDDVNAIVELFGTGAQPVLSSDQGTIDFGESQVGAFRDRILGVTNTGDGSLIISDVSITGPYAEEFYVLENTTNLQPLASLARLDLTVNFLPTSIGEKYAYLIFTSNSTTSPDTIFLTGTGAQTYTVDVQHDSAVGGSPLTIAFTFSDIPTTSRQIMYYRNAGQIDYQSTNLQGSGPTFTGVIPGTYVNLRGIEYYILMTVDGVDYTYPPSDPQYNPLTARVFYKQYKPPITLTPMKYKMISVPGEAPDEDAETVLADDYGPYDKRYWRLSYYYPTATSDYIEYPFMSDFEYQYGMAFWLITRSGTLFDVDNLYSMPSDDSLYVTFRPGWNQVGCPFAFPVSIYDMVSNGELDYPVYYDNSINDYRYQIEILQPWEGYFVYNRETVPVTIAIPPVEAHGTLPKSKTPFTIQNSSEYVLQLSARIPDTDYQDSQNYLGMLSESSEDLDGHDFYEAPPIGDYIQLSVFDDENRFAGNFKPASADGQKWDLLLNSSFNVKKNIRVSLTEKGTLGDSLNLYILDKDYNAVIPVKDGGFEIDLNAGSARHLAVIIGTGSYAQNNSNGIPLVPYAFNLEQNYPNPFNPETTIQYQLARQNHVKLEIFNTLGHKIRTLVDGVQNTGEHRVVWDGLNDAAYRVAGGLYFYRLSSNDLNSTKKMILIR